MFCASSFAIVLRELSMPDTTANVVLHTRSPNNLARQLSHISYKSALTGSLRPICKVTQFVCEVCERTVVHTEEYPRDQPG